MDYLKLKFCICLFYLYLHLKNFEKQVFLTLELYKNIDSTLFREALEFFIEIIYSCVKYSATIVDKLLFLISQKQIFDKMQYLNIENENLNVQITNTTLNPSLNVQSKIECLDDCFDNYFDKSDYSDYSDNDMALEFKNGYLSGKRTIRNYEGIDCDVLVESESKSESESETELEINENSVKNSIN